ncbi:MAG: 30S ribosome-binding factor RbfA [Gemmatimonadota bacterium]
MSRRTARLNEQFKREVSDILHRDVRDPRVGTPTVTDVEVTSDLWLARVYVRPGPGEDLEERGPELLAGLEAAEPFLRRELAERLSLRRIPELRFELDRTLDHALRIESILREVLPPDPEGDEGRGVDTDKGTGEGDDASGESEGGQK